MEEVRAQFLTLLLRHEPDLRAFIGSLVTDRHRREDVFQEVALTCWREFEKYDPGRPFGAWARGVAANKVLQARERDARFPVAVSPEAVRAVLDAFDRTEVAGSPPDAAEALRACVNQLPDHSRSLVALRYDDGLDCAAIAGRLGRTVDAVYQALSRVRSALEECVRRRLAAEGDVT